MIVLTILTLFAIFTDNLAHLAQNSSSLANVTDAFKQARIVPSILPSFNPIALLDFKFSSYYTLPGELLPVPVTAMEPSFLMENNDTALKALSFVVVMVDPDAGTNSQVRHFLGGNFVLDNSGGNVMTFVNTTPALSEYVQPAPPPGTGAHRYTILAYIQPSGFNQKAPHLVNSSTPITGFNLLTFATAVKLGDPVAGNYFLAANNTPMQTTTSRSSSLFSTPNSAAYLLRLFLYAIFCH